ncbi:MAG: sugar transferase [Verrucomicrobiota bacterium]
MRQILICPAERTEVSALSESVPLTNLCILGNPFVFYWLEHFASSGVKEITLLCADRPNLLRELVGDGSRWGLRIEVLPELRELSASEALQKYSDSNSGEQSAVVIDHLPGLQNNIFNSYAEYFSAIRAWICKNPTRLQIGVNEVQPGVWVGMHSQISKSAQIIAPCWIGENVLIQEGVQLGPGAVLECGTVAEKGAEICESWIGKQTFVGGMTQVKHSLALGNTLVNFLNESEVKIADSFLLCALIHRERSVSHGTFFGRTAAFFMMLATSPFALVTILKAKYQGQVAFRPRRANPSDHAINPRPILYYEFANSRGGWRRWPQLWNVVRGQFTWIGNRPLAPIEAGKLNNDFERLWLASPIGLISQGDVEGCSDLSSDAAKAHASFYSAQSGLWLDLKILFRALVLVAKRKFARQPATDPSELKERPFTWAAR